jgi:hypothetical protein
VRRRELWEPLVDVVASMVDAGEAGALRVRLARVDLPLELELRGGHDAPRLLGDLPRWRWPTVFDRQVARLTAVWEEVPR